jgi:protein-L-isoaspartate(D-aspartate) O-methyltransferase
MQKPSRWPLWIEYQLVRRGISDERVLSAMSTVPRAAFVPPQEQDLAEGDWPLPIGCGQTISQPYIVALSLQALELKGPERVLDIGTGSGYQAALLSHLAAEVYTIEVHAELLDRARTAINLHRGVPVQCLHGDGRLGWPDAAPFDAIVVGAWSEDLPAALTAQLGVGGRLVIPLGAEHHQVLVRLLKQPAGTLLREELESVRFVPLVHGQRYYR